jgi:hypothetical protein
MWLASIAFFWNRVHFCFSQRLRIQGDRRRRWPTSLEGLAFLWHAMTLLREGIF